MSAMMWVVLDFITTLGLTFHPCPKSLDAFSPVPVVAFPPSPLAPLKFSGLIERGFASDNLYILLMFEPSPLNLSCAVTATVRRNKDEIRMTNDFFIESFL